MSDFVVQIGGDFSELLRGLQQLESRAKQSGQAVGQGLAEGIQGFSNRSIAALQAELAKLQSRQTRVAVDSRDFDATGRQIQAVQRQLDQLQQRRLALQVDPRSIDGLTLKLQGLQKELNSVAVGSEKFKQLQAAIRATEQELANAGQAAQRFGLLNSAIQGVAFSLANTLTNAAGQAVAALGTIPDTVRGFDNAKAAVRTLGVNADDLGGRLLKLSQTTNANVSAVDLLKASYDVASSGFATAADATNVLAAAQDGAVGGFTDINTVADATTSVLNAYGLASDQAKKLVDGFIQTQNDGKITVGQYAGEIGRIAPVAKSAGVGIDELNAAISAATAQGVPVGSTFAGLRQAISSILDPSEKARAYAKGLGLDFSAAALQAKGFGGFMAEVAAKTGGSAEAIIKLTGSVEAQAAIQPLVNDQLKKYNQFLGNQKNSADAAAKASEAASATIDGSLKRLGNTIANLSVQAFQGLTPIVAGSINAITGFLNAVNSIPGPIKLFVGAALGIPSALIAGRLALAAFNTELVATKFQAVVAGVQQLATTIRTIWVADLARGKAAWEAFVVAVKSGQLADSIGALTAKFLPLTLAIAGVTAAVGTYQRIAAGAAQATAGQEEVNARLTASFREAGIEVGALTSLTGPLERAWQSNSSAIEFVTKALEGVAGMFRSIPVVGGLVADAVSNVGRKFVELTPAVQVAIAAFDAWRRSVSGAFDTQQIESVGIRINQLNQYTTSAQNEILKLLAAIKQQGGAATDDQKQRLGELNGKLAEAQAAVAAYQAQLKQLAAEARNSGNEQLAKELDRAAASLNTGAGLTQVLTDKINAATGATGARTAATLVDSKAQEEAGKLAQQRADAERQLNEVLAQAPVRQAEAQLAIGTQLVGLAKAAGDAEQSRFGVVRAGLEFQLAKLQELGAGEDVLRGKRLEIEQLDRAALTARYQALTQQQALEVAMLRINQEKAILDANFGALQQRGKLLEAEYELKKAIAGGDADAIAKAQAGVGIQTALLNIQGEKVGLLQQTQPIEAAILSLTQQTAINGERAKAAQMGYKVAADGSLVAVNALAQLSNRVGIITGASAQEQERYRRIAEGSGLALGRAANGAVVLGRTQADVTQGVQALNQELDRARARYGLTAKGAETTANYANRIRGSLAGAAGPADFLEGAFTSSGQSAPKVAQASRDFAGWLSGAAGYGQRIAGLNLDRRFASVATSTGLAADEAKGFYYWLQKASQLPSGLWTGGPAEAGEQYRINELGQEAFLSAGRLSLIDRPANSLWRAPSKGVVIPAGITARLQATGVLPDSAAGSVPFRGAGAGTAELAVEVGKLRQEVAELARKDWGVHVQMRTGPTASQVMNQLHRLR